MNPKKHPDNHHQGSVPVSDNHPTLIKTWPNFSIEMQVKLGIVNLRFWVSEMIHRNVLKPPVLGL
jgi:hypothetical protein